jgi:hypothetical protein
VVIYVTDLIFWVWNFELVAEYKSNQTLQIVYFKNNFGSTDQDDNCKHMQDTSVSMSRLLERIMDRYEGPHTSLTIALHRGLYLAIIMDRYERPLTALNIALHGGL